MNYDSARAYFYA